MYSVYIKCCSINFNEVSLLTWHISLFSTFTVTFTAVTAAVTSIPRCRSSRCNPSHSSASTCDPFYSFTHITDDKSWMPFLRLYLHQIKLSNVRGVKMKCVLYVSCVGRNKLLNVWVSPGCDFTTSTHHDPSVYSFKPNIIQNSSDLHRNIYRRRLKEGGGNMEQHPVRNQTGKIHAAEECESRNETQPECSSVGFLTSSCDKLHRDSMFKHCWTSQWGFFLVWTSLCVSSLAKHPGLNVAHTISAPITHFYFLSLLSGVNKWNETETFF